MKRLKPGEVDLHRRRMYWEVFERKKVIAKADREAAREDGIRFACWMVLGDLPKDSDGYKWAKAKAALWSPLHGSADVAQEYYDREAPKDLEKFMEEGRKGRKVVRKDKMGPFKPTVKFF
jgi:hypothetical protein